MARLPWFRMYTEVRTDRKLATLDDSQHRVWLHLLCYSAESEPRGVVDLEDTMLVALECASGDETQLLATVERLERLHILEREGSLVYFRAFEARQYDKPSDRPEAVRERVRRHRERKREVLEDVS